MKILFASSSREAWYFKGVPPSEHFANAPYSIDAIGYHLEKLGHDVRYLGWQWTSKPWTLAKEIDEFKPDIVYTYGSATAFCPILVKKLWCKHRKFKVVHGWDDDYRKIWQEMFGMGGWWIMAVVQKAIVKYSDAVVTLSRHLQKKGREWGVDCHYIPNGADEPGKAEGKTTLEGRFRLVYTGDKARWKKTEDICRAMREVPKDVKLYFTGRDREWLRQYASENCVFLGWLSKEEQYHVMSQADAFAVTSDQDCNAKLQEYLRWHKPIIAYDGQMNNVLANGKSVLLVKEDGYARGIMKLANEPEFCRKLADNAAEELPVYTWAEIAKQFEDYFRDLTGQ